MTLDDVMSVPVETDPELRLQRSHRQQAMLAKMALEAAEEKWPGFNEVASFICRDETEAYEAMGPLA